ncbi:hypothetical protein SEA_PHARAOH_81 [Mycobacterium phage Pharaoh]|uniref:Uncharacterized protein n=1 Tax=Mycobacterium phage Pharaoh TaxID=2530140 RepID=A0A481W3C4_9CAUD|nr:hypothetical protein KIV59_gp09 [Mycobacterium phage Pharaoh]QBJ00269.1 hypothetical protein SEA_PHARAOH_81 [Mycobacterium phage Pharaoh]
MQAISNKMRDVRVTARQSITQDFIAPDLSPVRRVDLELDKGIPGWTDHDVKIEDENTTGLPKGHAERLIEEMTIGDYRPKARVTTPRKVLNTTGPTSHYRAMQARAAKLGR